MGQEWNIKARGDTCQTCGNTFVDGQDFYSRLIFEEGYQRQDFCTGCWADPPPAEALSIWKTTFRVPPPPTPEALKKETAESLLRELMESNDLSKKNTIFILAVMLERRRIFVERDVQVREDGSKIRVYEHKKTGETFLIPDPGLRLQELEHVQQEVVTMLGGTVPGGGQASQASSETKPAEESRVESVES